MLKTQHKFTAELRLLIGDKLGIKQQLVNANVTVKIIAEDDARLLSSGNATEQQMYVLSIYLFLLFFSGTVGSISNDFEKLTLDDKGHMSAKFNNTVCVMCWIDHILF